MGILLFSGGAVGSHFCGSNGVDRRWVIANHLKDAVSLHRLTLRDTAAVPRMPGRRSERPRSVLFSGLGAPALGFSMAAPVRADEAGHASNATFPRRGGRTCQERPSIDDGRYSSDDER